MDAIRQDLINDAIDKANELTDSNPNDIQDLNKKFEFRMQIVSSNHSLGKEENSETIKRLNKDHDKERLLYNEGPKRFCENCKKECLVTSYCESCIQDFLKKDFSIWTSGNVEMDNLIHKCQMESLTPYNIIEWIPYKDLKNIKYLTKGGCSEIYSADWIGGPYDDWDSKELLLKRKGTHKVILKKLKNVEKANQNWFDEVCEFF